MTSPSESAPPRGRYLAFLCLGALGIVFGDIGTSPLYALRECFGPHAHILATPGNVLGILSLIFWSLVVVISIKYLVFVMRADNAGEGGILALLSLLQPNEMERRAAESDVTRRKRRRWWLVKIIGIFGAALLYGDGMITPAISVLSALEGLEVAAPALHPWIVPATILILFLFFRMQRVGTGGVGAVFGPVTLVWFAALAVLGVRGVLLDPGVLVAMDPRHAISFFQQNRLAGFHTLGSVFLVVTGGEALYADMGHFGARPIRLVWFWLVLPCLLLNYFGQGALLLHEPGAIDNPFFRLAPGWAVVPLVILATAATVIASQAVISGAFSLSSQAVQLGYLPRLARLHTSAREAGQIYMPAINTALAICTMGLVLGFRTSSNLAAAYGIAVTGTMVVTTLLFFLVSRNLWGWKLPAALGLALLFLVPDLAFFAANLAKIHDGGWFPLLVGGVVFLLMTTWRRGRLLLDERLAEISEPLGDLLERLRREPPLRIPGTAVFLMRPGPAAPHALLQNLRHNRVLHERLVLLSIVFEERPRVPVAERWTSAEVQPGVFRGTIHFGFMEDPDLPAALAELAHRGDALAASLADVTYFLGTETLFATDRPGMAIWREKLFAVMARNSRRAANAFRLPTDRIVEIGTSIEL